MKYTVVHSKDPYLLARLATDLQMEGYGISKYNEHDWHPFTMGFCWAEIWYKNDINFHSHNCLEPDKRHELTSRNYIKVLTQILEP